MYETNQRMKHTQYLYTDKLKSARKKNTSSNFIKEIPNSVYFITKYIPFIFRLGGIFMTMFRCSLWVLMRTSTLRENLNTFSIHPTRK